MAKPTAYGSILLVTSCLISPAALAQTGGGQTGAGAQTAQPSATNPTSPDPAQDPLQDQTAAPGDQTTDEPPVEEEVEVSTPGSDPGPDIVVVGRNTRNVIRSTPQVVSLLSTADIARTGEGDIAGALQRVTGLSVVGAGFVYVRGLGDRYSSSLLNGSPLPSPEPLRRTVPLDIFPTNIVSSALVQKSYSVNYAGEFGGGVINLTTKSVPKESFLDFGASIGFDTASTYQLGYVYDGGTLDWLGYDTGARSVPSFLRNGGGATIGTLSSDQVNSLNNAQTTILQQNNTIPENFSGAINLGHTFDVGATRIGIIASANVSNTFRTRDSSQQDTIDSEGALRSDFQTILTDNRIVLDGLFGLGAEFGAHKVRWTNLYIHDTLKQGRLSSATVYPNSSGDEVQQQNTNWFERQLINTQLVGEFKFGDLSVDLRGSYANSKRNSPYERSFSYRFDRVAGLFQNNFNDIGENAFISFSELDENLYSGQADLAYKLPLSRPVTLSAGYYYSDNDRTSSRYTFQYRTNNGAALPNPFAYLRPDYLLSDFVVNTACTATDGGGCIRLVNVSGNSGAAQYDAALRIHAGYVQGEGEIIDGLKVTAGVRYETARERVSTDNTQFVGALLNNSYWLPAGTVTYNVRENMQVRLHASQTIARPQFRELAPQLYRDFDSDRQFLGNSALEDSTLTNVEGRYEWFFARDQRFTLAGFYKHIDRPIEQIGFFPTTESPLQTGFSNAPSADLYGAEIEVQKYFPLDFINGDFFATRRLLVVANYTYTKSTITADDSLVPTPIQNGSGVITRIAANQLFVDGQPLTGQSDHLANLQVGIEKTDSLSQLTVLMSYASDRVTNRGPVVAGEGFLPPIVERPGFRLDVVGRQGITFKNFEMELKVEARNLTGTRYQEFQTFENGTRVDFNSYRLGRIFSVGLSAKL